MAILNCKMCGGTLELVPGSAIAECDSCGRRQTVPLADSDQKLRMFDRANRLRAGCEFDQAESKYEDIVQIFPQEAEAWWGMILSRYGIEYVTDPATGHKMPTCHRASFDSVLADPDLAKVLRFADPEARELYQAEAETIETLRKRIMDVSRNEKPYDIFICYKETDQHGRRTMDSVLAQDIYDELTRMGYRTFFSRITLQDKLGSDYEPYIFAALNSAKVMLLVTTDVNHVNAVWVRNEWGRFLKIRSKNPDRYLIPCCKIIGIEDLPEPLNWLQGANLDQMGAIQDLKRNMEKYIPLNTQPKAQPKSQTDGDKLQSQLERGMLALEDGDWNDAKVFFENVLNLDPKNAQAYFGELMVEYKVRRESDLDGLMKPINISKNYEKVLRFGDPEMQNRLLAHSKTINHRIDDYNRKKNHLADSRVAVLAEIDKARYDLQQADQKTRQIQQLIGQTNSHLVGLQAVAAEKQRKVDELKAWKPRNVGKIIFYLLCIIATVAGIFYCLENPEFTEEGWSVLMIFAVHYLIWVVRDLQKGKTVGRIILRTLLLLLKAVFSIGVCAAVGLLVLMKIFPDLSDMEQFLFCCIPAVYFPGCILKQLQIRGKRRKNIRIATREVEAARCNYRKEADNNPELKRLTQELEDAQSEYTMLERNCKQRIHEINQSYIEEARKGGFIPDDLVPKDLRMNPNI